MKWILFTLSLILLVGLSQAQFASEIRAECTEPSFSILPTFTPAVSSTRLCCESGATEAYGDPCPEGDTYACHSMILFESGRFMDCENPSPEFRCTWAKWAYDRVYTASCSGGSVSCAGVTGCTYTYIAEFKKDAFRVFDCENGEETPAAVAWNNGTYAAPSNCDFPATPH